MESPKLKVLMVAACPFPANYGSPASIREMSETLAGFGHEVHIITYPFGDDLPVLKAIVHRIPCVGLKKTITVGPTLEKPIMDFLMVWHSVRLIWKYKCDVIHAHNYEGALVGICAKILTWRPLLYNAVNSMSDELPSYNFIKPDFLARWLATALDWFVPKIPNQITTVSEELKGVLHSLGVPERKLTVVPAGVIPKMFEKSDPTRFRKTLNLGDSRVVMYTGTVDPFQRVDYLFEAMAHLVEDKEFSDVKLVVLCPFIKASHRKELGDLAAKLKIEDRVIWVESHPLEDLADYLATADVAVAPRPQCPGHPVKLLNYMCCSRGIVVAAGAAKGIKHLVNGYVCKDHDTKDMAKGIGALLKDPELAKRLGKQAYQTILEEYDWVILCRKIEALYYKMLGVK